MKEYVAGLYEFRRLVELTGFAVVFVFVHLPSAQLGLQTTGVLASLVCLGCLIATPAIALVAMVGHLAVEFLQGGFRLVTLFEAAGFFLAGAVAYTVWDQLGLRSGPAGDWTAFLRIVGAFLAGIFVSTASFAATIAWGYAVLGLVPFFVLGPSLLLSSALVTVALGLPLLFLLWQRGSEHHYSAQSNAKIVDGGNVMPTMAWWEAVLPLGWLVVGTLLSAGYQSYQLVPMTSFEVRDLEFLHSFAHLFLFGPSGIRAQWVLGTVGFVAVLALVARN